MKGWNITRQRNVIPRDDLREHKEGEDCWCNPTWDDGVLVHHAADEREKHEVN